MKATIELIRSITKGALRVTEENGLVCFHRFTPYQQEVLRARNFHPREIATAGIRLEFTCLEGEVRMVYTDFKGGSTNRFALDATINGVDVIFENRDIAPEDIHTCTFTVPKCDKPARVAIYLPNFAGLRIKELYLPEGVQPVEKKGRLLCLGDSITQGAISQRNRLAYANLTADLLDMELLNQGIGGDKFHAPNIDPELPFAPDIITVAYGTNDWAASIPDLAGKIDDYFKKLRTLYPEAPVFAIPPLWRGNTDGVVRNGLTLADARELVREKAEKYGCIAVDPLPLVPHNEAFFADKVLHPNDLGFVLYGTQLAEVIKKTLNV